MSVLSNENPTTTDYRFPDAQAAPQDGELDLEERHALRRVAGLSTELEDVSEVEYRALRLERVVLMGVWTEGTLAMAENSLRELSRLAETAGSEVLDALDPAPRPPGRSHLRRRGQGAGNWPRSSPRMALTPSSATGS